MKPTSHENINNLLSSLSSNIQQVLGKDLVGLYLYGSATAGDFDPDLSDIDLLAALQTDITDKEFSELENMHDDFILKYPKWKDRIEVAYLSLHGLKTFKNERSQLVVISPGEPLNIHYAGHDWLINWYVIQENGIALFGPHQSTLIPKISIDEYVAWVKKQTLLWQERVNDFDEQTTRGSAAYAVYTMCRAMYSARYGRQVSKNHAISWVKKEFPQWIPLLELAEDWRKRQWEAKKDIIGSELPKIIEFVNFAIDQVIQTKPTNTD
jgi:predicted nucleotidyltransferase